MTREMMQNTARERDKEEKEREGSEREGGKWERGREVGEKVLEITPIFFASLSFQSKSSLTSPTGSGWSLSSTYSILVEST